MTPDILYLSHCAPTIPDKGERIRAYHEVQYLARRYRVHVAAFTRDELPLEYADALRPICASLHIELLRTAALPRMALDFLWGKSISVSYYESRSLRAYVETLARRVRFSAAVAFSSAMASYAPEGVPLLLDMVDVDSEKWAEYARRRFPGWLYALEAGRLRRHERQVSRAAQSVLLTTAQETALLQQIAPGARVRAVENGVDSDYFNPVRCPPLAELSGRRYIVMVGAMSYYPNADGALWFAHEVFPQLRAKAPEIDFLIVGHSPSAAVQRLARLPGVTVTGYVPDVRPYVAGSAAVAVPLRIARGVQNKVLEALSMGKAVLASAEISRTFGDTPPDGLHICRTADDYCRRVLESLARGAAFDPSIRDATVQRFSWERQLAIFEEELRYVIGTGARVTV